MDRALKLSHALPGNSEALTVRLFTCGVVPAKACTDFACLICTAVSASNLLDPYAVAGVPVQACMVCFELR